MTTAGSDSRDRVLKELESLQGLPYVPSEYLNFRIGLLRAQLEVFDSVRPPSPRPALPLRPGSLTLQPELLSRMLVQAADALTEPSPARGHLLKLAQAREIIATLAEASAFGPNPELLKKISLSIGVPEDALFFFGRALAAPYLRKIVLAVGEKAGEISEKAQSCPCCGSAPGLSLLREESGKRFLVCPLCGMDWEYPRLSCPFCGQEKALELIREDERAPRWIEACSSCPRYLKSIDARKVGAEALIPLKESIASLYLEYLAEKLGCVPGLPYVALR